MKSLEKIGLTLREFAGMRENTLSFAVGLAPMLTFALLIGSAGALRPTFRDDGRQSFRPALLANPTHVSAATPAPSSAR